MQMPSHPQDDPVLAVRRRQQARRAILVLRTIGWVSGSFALAAVALLGLLTLK
jgi:hypothetical protein